MHKYNRECKNAYRNASDDELRSVTEAQLVHKLFSISTHKIEQDVEHDRDLERTVLVSHISKEEA